MKIDLNDNDASLVYEMTWDMDITSAVVLQLPPPGLFHVQPFSQFICIWKSML